LPSGRECMKISMSISNQISNLFDHITNIRIF